MAIPIGAIGNVTDPRLEDHEADKIGSYRNRVLKTLHDPNVQLEEYLHYAKITRAQEEHLYGAGSEYAKHKGSLVTRIIPGLDSVGGRPRLPWSKRNKEQNTLVGEGASPVNSNEDASSGDAEKKDLASRDRAAPEGELPVGQQRHWSVVTDDEWTRASRAARTATWGAVFYLITTDILGPFSAPWAFSQLGWGPGAALYTVFGALAGYSGWQLWQMFMSLDSDRYPLKNYGDIGFRVYGQWFRIVCNVVQSLQFFLNVGLIIISTGQSLAQLSVGNGARAPLCFIACTVIATAAGAIVGQIRTLAKFGWLANLAVWLNILTIFFTMGVVANSTPNYTAVAATSPFLWPGGNTKLTPPPITTSGGVPSYLQFQDNLTGLMNCVFAYGGATLFCELMAEMRRPWDFWKGLICADVLIYTLYVLFGMFVYGYQGQYSYNIAYQGVNPYTWQTVGNVFQLVTGVIAACLYGNIGIKVLYANVGRELLHFPLLESHKGKVIFALIVPVYWAGAFAVASSIPQFSNFQALVGAVCILQFTYTFPPFMLIGFKAQRDSILPEESFDPVTGTVNRVDHGWKRWMRGLKKDKWANMWDTFYAVGALTTAILGTYSAIYNMAQAYNNGSSLTGWSCNSPTGG